MDQKEKETMIEALINLHFKPCSNCNYITYTDNLYEIGVSDFGTMKYLCEDCWNQQGL